MMGWGYGGGMGFGLGLLFQLIFWVIIIAVVVWAVKEWSRESRLRDVRNREDEAMAILRERYARGEITKEEFEARKRDLLIR